MLHKYGGIYADLDYECIKNFEHIIRADKVSIGASPYSGSNFETHQNALMISPPQHPFWETVFKFIEINKNDASVLTATGPDLIMKAIKEDPNDIFTLESKLFAPNYSDDFKKATFSNYVELPLIKDDNICYARHYGTCQW